MTISNKPAFKRLSIDEMRANGEIIANEFDEKLSSDEEFAKAVLIIAKWWQSNYMKCGHKKLARLLLQEVQD